MTDAQQAEATGELMAVEYNGDSYQVDPTAMTWETLEADEGGNFTRVLADMLGPEEFQRFKTANPQPLVRTEAGLVGVAAEMRNAILVAMGNLGASSPS